MATPEKNYKKTIQALQRFTELENRGVISDGELEQALQHYWDKSSWKRVVDKLLEDGRLKRFGGKFLIQEKPSKSTVMEEPYKSLTQLGERARKNTI